jgi:hypothetical protein
MGELQLLNLKLRNISDSSVKVLAILTSLLYYMLKLSTKSEQGKEVQIFNNK